MSTDSFCVGCANIFTWEIMECSASFNVPKINVPKALSFIQCTQIIEERIPTFFWKKYYNITTWGVISLIPIYKQYTAQDDAKNV